MALVKCPECGRENISSLATACPNCGFPIAEHIRDVLKVEGYSDGFYRTQFDNGLADGACGLCIIDYIWSSGPCRVENDYSVQDNHVQVKSQGGSYCYEYFYKHSYLFSPESDWAGCLPQSDQFSYTLKRYTEGNDEPLTLTFYEDGTYNEYVQCGCGGREYRPGVYRRSSDLIILQPTKIGLPHILAVEEDNVHCVEFILDEKAQIAKQLLDDLGKQEKDKISPKAKPITVTKPLTDPQKVTTAPINAQINSTAIKCPYCQSVRVKKISALGRFASFGVWGFASSKVGKQWHCQSCNSDF